MPTIGGRSGGCHSCRKMKVKCDERRPGCFRCEKAGRQCPGYREEMDNFRSMNKQTELKALEVREKRRKSREPPTPPTTGSLPEERPVVKIDQSAAGPSSSAPRRSSSASRRQGFLAPTMSMDWDTQAIHQFFDNFVIQPDASRSLPGFFEYLPELYFEQTTDNFLSDAVKAAAFMYLAKRSSIQSFAVQARRSYGKALVQASSNLNVQEEAKSDHMLATLSVLELYEIICGEKSFTTAWETHAPGQAMVLRIRGNDQFRSRRGQAMFRCVNKTLQTKDQAQKRPPTLSMDRWPDSVFQAPQERDAFRLIDKVTALQHRGWSLVEEAQTGMMPSNDMIIFLRESVSLDHELQDWKDWAPNQWRPWTTPNYQPSPSNSPAARPAMEYPKKIHLFHSSYVAALWCHLRAARIRLLQIMLEVNSILAAGGIQLSPAFSWSVLHTQIIDTVDSICNSVPYLLGEVDESGVLHIGSQPKPIIALCALWPLHVAALVRDIEDPYFNWIMEQLYRIGTVVGCRQAIALEKHHLFRRPSIANLDPALEAMHFEV